MASDIPFLSSPFVWILFSALFCAAALSRALRPDRHPAGDWERSRATKWTLFCLYLCLAIVAALGAVFVPGPEKIRDLRLLYFFAACTAVLFMVLRFKKSFGILTLILLLGFGIVVLLFLQSLSAFTGETEIAQVRVLAVQEGRMKLEVSPAKEQSTILWMEGTYFAPVVKVVIFEDYFVFLGAKTWYRFEGLTSFRPEMTESGVSFRQQNTDYYFPLPAGIPAKLWEFYERYETRIPGVRSAQVEMDLKRARELSLYSLRIQNDGGLEILELD